MKRCPSYKEGTTISQLLNEFIKTSPKKSYNKYVQTLDLFLISISRCWECPDCEYTENYEDDSSDESSVLIDEYSSMHGIEGLFSEISNGFLKYFLIRKCMTSDYERKEATKLMMALVKFCKKKDYWIGYGDAKSKSKKEKDEEIKEQIADISVLIKFNGEKIGEMLQELTDNGYWKSLEKNTISNQNKLN